MHLFPKWGKKLKEHVFSGYFYVFLSHSQNTITFPFDCPQENPGGCSLTQFVPFFMFVEAGLQLFKTAQAALSCHIRIEGNRQVSAQVTQSTDESFAAVEVRVVQSIPTQPYSQLYQRWQQRRPPYYHSSQPTFTSPHTLSPVHLQLRNKLEKIGQAPNCLFFLGFTWKAFQGAVKCFNWTSNGNIK